MRSYIIILLIGLFTFCSSPSNAKVAGLVKSTCTSKEAVLAIAELDKKSSQQGFELYKAFIKQGVCGILSVPTILQLEKLIHQYVDAENNKVEVWKVYNQEHYALLLAQHVTDIPNKKGQEI